MILKNFKTYEKIRWYYKGKLESDAENDTLTEDFDHVFWKVKVSLHEEYYEDLYRRLCKGNFDAYDCFVSFKGISLAKHPAAKGHFYINLDRPISDNFDVRYIGHMFNDGYEWYINRGYKYLGDLKEWLDENNY